MNEEVGEKGLSSTGSRPVAGVIPLSGGEKQRSWKSSIYQEILIFKKGEGNFS